LGRAEAVTEAFQQRQKDTPDALKALEEIIEEINRAEREGSEMVLNPEAFAVYWKLSKGDFPVPEKVAKDMEKFMKNIPTGVTQRNMSVRYIGRCIRCY